MQFVTENVWMKINRWKSNGEKLLFLIESLFCFVYTKKSLRWNWHFCVCCKNAFSISFNHLRIELLISFLFRNYRKTAFINPFVRREILKETLTYFLVLWTTLAFIKSKLSQKRFGIFLLVFCRKYFSLVQLDLLSTSFSVSEAVIRKHFWQRFKS